jgi:hypothetical protein
MNTKIETITPAIAQAYLEKNTANRNLRECFVSYLANEMIAGRWKLTNQGIAFFTDGTLADGQHRLSAIIQSGATVDMQVTRGMEKDAMSAIDVGAKRSIADFLHLHHGVKDANAVVAAARQIISIFFGFQNYTVPAEVVKMVVDYYHADIAAAITAVRGFKPANKSWLVAVLSIARHRNKQAMDALLANLATGENLKVGNPAHTLREWLVSGSEHHKGCYARARIEAALNICHHQVGGTPYRMPKSGTQGFNYFIPQERKLIESIRPEIAHILKR